ncbi:uncharacterized protein LOC117192204 isoform X3 [Drosophila miranda]|uniref:uncharacterized protein LOC117192204 isoform X2 n=1 Tax=Drosophila miranda TaxID=7229 RepID=UPI00143F6513|nr:uncharacterized protein LOC117192204 isoform X2 [Drosophila miranda]XP_033252767.1 uncharacterized protein LOC117192204 isoform X2 [Drosophila miranda]XP_033252768.1 uncharacterized protein LOC117192204 isoform X3 [Drosophila miranda]
MSLVLRSQRAFIEENGRWFCEVNAPSLRKMATTTATSDVGQRDARTKPPVRTRPTPTIVVCVADTVLKTHLTWPKRQICHCITRNGRRNALFQRPDAIRPTPAAKKISFDSLMEITFGKTHAPPADRSSDCDV